MKFSTYCADVGSIKSGNFGWACEDSGGSSFSGSSIQDFASSIFTELREGVPVALGFECPLFIPVGRDPIDVLKQRKGESGRPWAAGAGTSSLVTGLAESFWVLARIHEELPFEPPLYFSWPAFREAGEGILLWEAFVTKDDKAGSHEGDAEAAIRGFMGALPNPEDANVIREDTVFSLIAASALRAGWAGAAELIGQPCLVIRPQEDLFEAVRAKGERLAWQSWDSGGPGAGAGQDELWEYAGKYFVYHDAGMDQYDDAQQAMAESRIASRTDATDEIWISDKIGKRSD